MGQELPFQWARRPCSRGLWYDLAQRKAALEAQQRIPAVVRADPVGIPMPAFVRAEPGGIPMPAFVPAEREGIPMPAFVPAEPEGIPDPWRALEEARIRVPEGDGAAEVQQVSSRTRARSSPAVSRSSNKISGAGRASSISGGDNHEQDQDTAGLTSSSISSFDVRPAGLPSGMWTGDSRERFLAELRSPPARELNVGGMDSRHS